MRLRSRNPDSGSDTFPNCAGSVDCISNIAGVATTSLRLSVVDGGDRDGGLQIVAGPQQFETKRQFLGAPDARVRIEANAAVLFGAQFVEARGQAVVLRRIGSSGPVFGIRQQGIVAERIGGRRLLGQAGAFAARADD